MSILLNDFSLAGQFASTHTFLQSLEVLMQLRQVSESSGHKIECSDVVLNNQTTDALTFYEAIQTFHDNNKKRAVLAWINKSTASWGKSRLHNDDDYLTCSGEVVTGTAIGEAAYRNLINKEASLVSFSPSNWEVSPINVEYFYDNEKSYAVNNHWAEKSLVNYLESIQSPIQSWEELEKRMRGSCGNICFSEDAFSPLFPHPFMSGAADRISFLLETLNHLKECYDDTGKRTAEGHEMYQNFFTGKKGDGGRGALFTDSSASEKDNFKSELTFVKPGTDAEELFCPMHGKVQTPQFRIHFSWPMQAYDLFYVMYVGPKLTI